MTFLTMTFLGLETRNDLPKVSYMTALDYFVAINFAFLFASFIEFAIVHWYTKIGTGDYFIPPPDVMKRIALTHAENHNWFSGILSKQQQEAKQESRTEPESVPRTIQHQKSHSLDSLMMSSRPAVVPASAVHSHQDVRLDVQGIPVTSGQDDKETTTQHQTDDEERQLQLLHHLRSEISDVQQILSSVATPPPVIRSCPATGFRPLDYNTHQPMSPMEESGSRYLPSAFSTLYGQLDTTAYPHNRRHQQERHHNDSQADVSRSGKKSRAQKKGHRKPRTMEDMRSPGAGDRDFCPVHVSLLRLRAKE